MQAWEELVTKIVQSGKPVCEPMMDVCRFAGVYDWVMNNDVKYPILVHMSSEKYSTADLYVFECMLVENGIHHFVIGETSSYCNELICTILCNNIGDKAYFLSINDFYHQEIIDRYGHKHFVTGPLVDIRRIKRRRSSAFL